MTIRPEATDRPGATDTTVGSADRRQSGVRAGLQRLRQLVARDEGSATVEFVFLAVVILVPLIYVVLTVSMLQRAAFAVTQAARESGRAFAQADTAAQGPSRAAYAMGMAMEDQGFGTSDAQLRYVAAGMPCASTAVTPSLRPGSRFTVCVIKTLRLPGVPGFLQSSSNTLTGVFVVNVDQFRASITSATR
jgi:Flp pilus assembly protein TadG